MTQLTSAGLLVSRFADRLSELSAAVKAIFGSDLDLSPNTIDGQTIGVYAESQSNQDALLEEVYHSLSPQFARGASLSRLVELNGIRRVSGSFSIVTAKFGGQVGTVIPAGTLLHSAATLSYFSTNVQATVGSTGFVSVLATALNIGAETAPAGTLTEIDTPVFGIQTVTNDVDATIGRAEETDGELRIRRANSAAYPSQTILDGIYSAIANLNGVTRARVYENDQPVVNGVTGQPANSIYAVVQGGTDADIARTLFLKKTVGIPTIGTTSVTLADSQGISHLIKFSRPIQDTVYVRVVVSPRTGFPANGPALIKAAIAAYGTANYGIGDEVVLSSFYEAMAAIPGKSVVGVYLGLAPAPAGTANLQTLYDHIPSFAEVRVTVELV